MDYQLVWYKSTRVRHWTMYPIPGTTLIDIAYGIEEVERESAGDLGNDGCLSCDLLKSHGGRGLWGRLQGMEIYGW